MTETPAHEIPGTDEHAIWAAVNAVYAGFVDADRAAIDANISPDATMFDSDAMPVIHGKGELDAIRDARPPRSASDPVARLRAMAPEIRIWGDTAVLLHYLAVDLGDGSPEQAVRNTSVWRRAGGTGSTGGSGATEGTGGTGGSGATEGTAGTPPHWLMVHNHEDVMADPWLPAE
ncbi:hypothetical protein C5B96_03465 [Subtercola sp. Z020]|uniref:nuclear transport factor 2 family protein n=1 Tax=Subtercola sp. Z020 TaxID=2080582 RepID=UPI000CE7B5A9|nr:nuclear transport factor 2 family protein [Subtercola sp. Z020]PPF87854.1 hypothetical protein C5B96_03465 [Subtercola sp. Z020]